MCIYCIKMKFHVLIVLQLNYYSVFLWKVSCLGSVTASSICCCSSLMSFKVFCHFIISPLSLFVPLHLLLMNWVQIYIVKSLSSISSWYILSFNLLSCLLIAVNVTKATVLANLATFPTISLLIAAFAAFPFLVELVIDDKEDAVVGAGVQSLDAELFLPDIPTKR